MHMCLHVITKWQMAGGSTASQPASRPASQPASQPTRAPRPDADAVPFGGGGGAGPSSTSGRPPPGRAGGPQTTHLAETATAHRDNGVVKGDGLVTSKRRGTLATSQRSALGFASQRSLTVSELRLQLATTDSPPPFRVAVQTHKNPIRTGPTDTHPPNFFK